MGELVEGRWQRKPLVKVDAQGRFRRKPGGFRGWVRADGAAGPDGRSFPLAAGRYHLIVALACPWAHRTSLARALVGLEDGVSMDVVEPLLGEDGWTFAAPDAAPTPGSTHERLFGETHLHALYTRADAHYSGRVTTPVLWDRAQQTIVSNESADIMRMFGTTFAPMGSRRAELVPEQLPDYLPDATKGALDAAAKRVQVGVNEAVYRCGFAATQPAYDDAVTKLFAELDALEAELSQKRFLLGPRPCEADWRLFTTLVRFDWVYVAHFRCNLRRLADYPALLGYVRELFQWPHVADTLDEAQTKAHYFRSHAHLNPSGIVPTGFSLDLLAPHGRDALP